jgi:LPS sulfotransferase NodH
MAGIDRFSKKTLGNPTGKTGLKMRKIMRTVKGWITLQNPTVEKMALDLGLIQGHRQYTRFIILGRSRTGSNFLRGLLNDHPNIVTMGEILRNENEIDWDSAQYQTTPAILKQYQTQPLDFLNQIVFRKFRPSVQAVGFKLFYYHAQKEPFRTIWEELEEDTQLRVIHIKRRNILRTHLSRAQAARSGNWVNTTGEKERETAITLDPNALREDFEQTRRWEMEADTRFSAHPLFQVEYENLANNYATIIPAIQQFLKLPVHPVQPQTFKQSQLPISQAVSNYDALKLEFAHSHWVEFFEE